MLIFIWRKRFGIFDQLQRRSRCVMRRRLAWHTNNRGIGILPIRSGLETHATQLLCGNRSTAQDVDVTIAHGNNRRFNSVNRWSGIDDQRNAIVELIQDMLRGRWTNAAESICARRGERPTERANNFGKNWMCTNSNRNSVETSSHNFRNN